MIPQLLLVGSVLAVGVLHTIVPDHWVPITLIARQRGWSTAETARASLKAGTGHVLSTLAIALVVWFAGVVFAQRFGELIDTASSIALIGFGGWIAITSLLEMRGSGEHGHSHAHSHGYIHSHIPSADNGGVHGPELQIIKSDHGELKLSIFETGAPPRFRLTSTGDSPASVTTIRDDGSRQTFALKDCGLYWESIDAIPEPHQFSVEVSAGHGGQFYTCSTQFTEHSHDHHGHQHAADGRPTGSSSRTALLLILGSSPMVEGIPAFFAAGKYGIGLIAVMSLIFALSTIATYVVLCVYSAAGIRRVSLGPLEQYGEVLSGTLIALVGLGFWMWPVL